MVIKNGYVFWRKRPQICEWPNKNHCESFNKNKFGNLIRIFDLQDLVQFAEPLAFHEDTKPFNPFERAKTSPRLKKLELFKTHIAQEY